MPHFCKARRAVYFCRLIKGRVYARDCREVDDGAPARAFDQRGKDDQPPDILARGEVDGLIGGG